MTTEKLLDSIDFDLNTLRGVQPMATWIIDTLKIVAKLERKVAALEAARQPEPPASASDYEQLAAWLRRENEQLKEKIAIHQSKAAGEYWAWQGDGYDYLGSLTCPVLIPVAALRAIIAKQPPSVAVAEVVGRLNEIHEIMEKDSYFNRCRHLLAVYIDELKAKL